MSTTHQRLFDSISTQWLEVVSEGDYHYCFHDPSHAASFARAGRSLITAAKQGNDPLNLVKLCSRNHLNFQQLEEAIDLTAWFHDLGNVGTWIVTTKGKLEVRPHLNSTGHPILRSGVISANLTVEDLSVQAFQSVLPSLGPGAVAFLPIVKEMITATKFPIDPKNAFVPLVPLIDIVGQQIYNPKSLVQLQLGLLTEWSKEDKPVNVDSPRQSITFASKMFEVLLPKKSERQAVAAIWNMSSRKKELDQLLADPYFPEKMDDFKPYLLEQLPGSKIPK